MLLCCYAAATPTWHAWQSRGVLQHPISSVLTIVAMSVLADVAAPVAAVADAAATPRFVARHIALAVGDASVVRPSDAAE